MTMEQVGVTELKSSLSLYLRRVGDGEEFVVTNRGRPIARLVATDASNERLARLIEAGLVRPALSQRRPRPAPIKAAGTVSDLVAEQRGR